MNSSPEDSSSSRQNNISELRKAQDLLKIESSYLEEISRHAKIGGWHYLKDGKQAWLSDQVYEIYGLDKKAPFQVEKGVTFFKGDAQKQIIDSFNQLLAEGTSYDLVLPFQNAKDEDLWVRTKGIPIYEGDEIIGAWGVIQDITDLFLLQSENKIIQSCSSELHIVIKGNRILELNDRWSSVTGYDKSEALNRNWTDFLHPEDSKLAPNILDMIFSKKQLENMQVRAIHKDGHTIYLTFNAKLAPDDETIFAIARDISEIKLREIQLETALAKVNADNRAKDQFLMMMSHELRTPLNPILGFAEILLHDVENEEHLQYLKLIRDSATHLSSLVSDILDISSIESGKVSLIEKPFNLVEVIESVTGMLNDKAGQKGLSLSLDMDALGGESKPVTCFGDEKKFRQILINLINNAIKFTHQGSVTVTLLEPRFHDDKIVVTVQVADTGIGIPENKLEKIFEKFHQLEMTETRKYKGQGLGLALSRELAVLMGGDITVESSDGEGSVFTVNLRFRRDHP